MISWKWTPYLLLVAVFLFSRQLAAQAQCDCNLDTQPPTITCPPDVTIDCGASTDPSNTGEATASDNCGTVFIQIINIINEDLSCANDEPLYRIWNAIDSCGNSNQCTQLIQLIDNTPPPITCPPDVTICCGQTDYIIVIDPDDDCSNDVTIQFEQEIIQDSVVEGQQTVFNLRRAIDGCGNISQCVQTVQVVCDSYCRNTSALTALYNAASGFSWTNNNNWLNGMDPCDAAARWFGVSCDGSGNITGLNLYDNGLNGFIPPELGLLIYLVNLDLGRNQLSGNIPVELGNINALTSLFLDDNQLSGSVPAELGNLDNLQTLFLHTNQLDCFESGLEALCDNVVTAAVGGNPGNLDWSAFCATGAGACNNLSALLALYNATDGANWTNKTNWLNSMDPCDPRAPWYGVLCDGNGNVTQLSLSSNGLNGFIPPELEYLAELIELNLFNNQLSGTIPSELGNLTNLITLDLGANQLAGVMPAELGNLANLTFLWLDGNLLGWHIPEELGNLANLSLLNLGGNLLSGSIPSQLGNLTNLTTLSLGSNQFSGNIPPELSNLTNLGALWLELNQLDGNIPAGLGSLTSLSSLNLSGNQLEGKIPAELGGLSNLADLFLSENQLEGSVPSELANLNNLQSLTLDNNQLRCFEAGLSILCGNTALFVSATNNPGNLDWNAFCASGAGACDDYDALLALYNATKGIAWTNRTNWLNGMNPCDPAAPWYGVTCDPAWNVTQILLPQNKLNGFIPPEMEYLTHLTQLSFYTNTLSDSIPSELGGLTNLTYLDLGRNQLSGSIPPELGRLNNLQTLYLDANQLSGSAPGELGSLSNLQLMALDQNQLECFEAGLNALCVNVGLTVTADSNANFLDWNAFCASCAGACTDGGNISVNGAGETLVEICAGDGLSDVFDVELTGAEGAYSAWAITDTSGFILDAPVGPPFDLEDAGEGYCLIWHLSYEDSVLTLLPGDNIFDLQGCLDWSNPIDVIRTGVDGGAISIAGTGETQIEICAGDGLPDILDVDLINAEGPNSIWVITDTSGLVLATPSAPPFDFESAGEGYCLIWHLSYADSVDLVQPGDNVFGLQGCLDLSNAIDVIRQEGGGCQNPNLTVSPVLFLQGAYDLITGLMSDALRGGVLPLEEPYSSLGYTHVGGGGGESVLPAVFDVSGADAIVDWVFVALRDKNNFNTVIATRSALLQRDGDVVDVDGFSPVTFANIAADDYYVAVKHRNHLGVMSAAPVTITNTTTIVDFTSDLNAIFGGFNGVAGLSDGNLGLYSGDFDRNGQVQNTDYNSMVFTLGTAGYAAGDFDLNGQVQNTDLQLKLLPNIGKGQPFGL